MFSAASKTGSKAAPAANYIEDVFSTYLYTGNGSSQTITNNIDLSTKGGLVWIKDRGSSGEYHNLFDTTRGASYVLFSNDTAKSSNSPTRLTSFNSNGFTVGSNSGTNGSGYNEVSWSFAEQAKFFDVVTYTGDGVSGRTVAHNLGSVPGMIIIKRTDTTGNWFALCKNGSNYEILFLNTSDASYGTVSISLSATSTNLNIGYITSQVGPLNTSGATYVAYIYAHDAGGFGTSGTDNVISCGSFTSDGSGNATVSLGYEPQYFLVKCSSATDNWYILDVMRGFSQKSAALLEADLASAEANVPAYDTPIATGVSIRGMNPSATFIYMAIRRPMKVPTDATTVFSPVIRTGDGVYTTGFAGDFSFGDQRTPSSYPIGITRLTGGNFIPTTSTGAEQSGNYVNWASNTSFTTTSFYGAVPTVFWNFARRPGFMDVVCYTGTGSATTQAHNLGVAPELMIVKRRNVAGGWFTYNSTLGNTSYLQLQDTSGSTSGVSVLWNSTSPTSSVFTVGSYSDVNASGGTFVAYLFATCPGVSKVGSYTGNGGTQAIACGFTGGARFVLIKRTDATGDWYVYDTARGMTTLTDPYLLLNSTAAEAATLGSVTTTTGGFTLDATILTAINASGGTYIFLAIA
jgi:hypothetical protein